MSRDSERPLAVGQIRRQEMLESEAVYRVVELTGTGATLEVINAPGLVPGYRFEVARDAVARMALDDEGATGR